MDPQHPGGRFDVSFDGAYAGGLQLFCKEWAFAAKAAERILSGNGHGLRCTREISEHSRRLPYNSAFEDASAVVAELLDMHGDVCFPSVSLCKTTFLPPDFPTSFPGFPTVSAVFRRVFPCSTVFLRFLPPKKSLRGAFRAAFGGPCFGGETEQQQCLERVKYSRWMLQGWCFLFALRVQVPPEKRFNPPKQPQNTFLGGVLTILDP